MFFFHFISSPFRSHGSLPRLDSGTPNFWKETASLGIGVLKEDLMCSGWQASSIPKDSSPPWDKYDLFATLWLREKPGRNGCQSSLWASFGGYDYRLSQLRENLISESETHMKNDIHLQQKWLECFSEEEKEEKLVSYNFHCICFTDQNWIHWLLFLNYSWWKTGRQIKYRIIPGLTLNLILICNIHVCSRFLLKYLKWSVILKHSLPIKSQLSTHFFPFSTPLFNFYLATIILARLTCTNQMNVIMWKWFLTIFYMKYIFPFSPGYYSNCCQFRVILAKWRKPSI